MTTRKIKGFTDFIGCLRDGKKVRLPRGYYFLKDGVICFHSTSYKTTRYNCQVDSPDLDDMRVEEPEQLSIEVGKFYKTSMGTKVWIQCCSKYKEYKALLEGENTYFWVNEDGSPASEEYIGELQPQYYIVAEWEEVW